MPDTIGATPARTSTISNAVSDATFQPSEAHIHAIALLACSGALQHSEEYYPFSPMGYLQNIYFFGMFDFVLPHATAMYHLVSLKGGFTKTNQYQMAAVLEL